MKLRLHLELFYNKYNIPANGGINDRTFEVPLPLVKFKLPNFAWRKRMLYVHDLEHILNEQDTSWAGEIFIASWEISTGFLKSFPLIIFPLWTMGCGFWAHPKAVFRGFRKGHTDIGIARLPIEKDVLLDFTLEKLQEQTLNKKPFGSKWRFLIKFSIWTFLSQVVFLLPFAFIISFIVGLVCLSNF